MQHERESIERVVTVPDCSKVLFLQVLMRYVCMDGFSVSIDDVVELLVLADMYQIEGLKWCCMGSLESVCVRRMMLRGYWKKLRT